MTDTSTAAQNTTETLCETANKMGQKLRSVVDDASGDMSGLGEKLVQQIKERPLQSALVALGAGAILGMLLSR
jgi:ElaB/YqjD/DUF883 family membrane-anchored ribosome-binding protein